MFWEVVDFSTVSAFACSLTMMPAITASDMPRAVSQRQSVAFLILLPLVICLSLSALSIEVRSGTAGARAVFLTMTMPKGDLPISWQFSASLRKDHRSQQSDWKGSVSQIDDR